MKATSYNPFTLAGKTILVTGASSGIGKATAIECSLLGASLIITARNKERLDETLGLLHGEGHKAVICDITDSDQLNRLVESCGQLDGVAICSGIINTTPALFASLAKFNEVFDVNFFGPIELGRMLVKAKKLQRNSSLVWICSLSATSVDPGNGIYGSAKAAMLGWMRYFALEMKSKGIRVNTMSPGMIDTPAVHGGAVSEEQLQEDCKRYIYNRHGYAKEAAWAIIYLLSDATEWISGINMKMNGGLIQ